MLTLRILGAVARRTWLKVLRRPVTLTFSLVQPLMWMLFFGFLFQRYPIDSMGPGLRYLDFVLPGICAMTVLFGSSQSGIGLIRDMQTGFWERLMQTPTSPSLLLAGKLAADVTRMAVQAGLVLLIGLTLGAALSPSWQAVPEALAALVLFAWGLSSLSCVVALHARTPETMAVFVHIVNMPLLFTSTALVPHKHMPDWLAAVARYNPLSLTVDRLRAALLFRDSGPTGGGLLLLLVLAIALFSLASATVRRQQK